MGVVAVYTRLNGVILLLGDFMLYDSDDFLSQSPNFRKLPCKLRGLRQSIPFQVLDHVLFSLTLLQFAINA